MTQDPTAQIPTAQIQTEVPLPQSLEEAIAQAKTATKAALEAGYRRLQVELMVPELKIEPLAWQFLSDLSIFGVSDASSEKRLRVLFPDTGAAALARRNWGEVPFHISDIGTERTPVEFKIDLENDTGYVIIEPSAVEVKQVEKLSQLAEEKPVVLFVPHLEDVAIVGIGYAGRQLRERFLSKLESCYYLQPLEGAALYRCYPSPWQVWLETEDSYTLLAERSEKPMGEALNDIFAGVAGDEVGSADEPAPTPKRPGVLGQLQSFIRALSR